MLLSLNSDTNSVCLIRNRDFSGHAGYVFSVLASLFTLQPHFFVMFLANRSGTWRSLLLLKPTRFKVWHIVHSGTFFWSPQSDYLSHRSQLKPVWPFSVDLSYQQGASVRRTAAHYSFFFLASFQVNFRHCCTWTFQEISSCRNTETLLWNQQLCLCHGRNH